MKASVLEVLEISQNGVWLYWNAHEYFLSYETFPWFKEAKTGEIQILNVQQESSEYLYWPDLDVDLSLANITEPEKYPLVASRGV